MVVGVAVAADVPVVTPLAPPPLTPRRPTPTRAPIASINPFPVPLLVRVLGTMLAPLLVLVIAEWLVVAVVVAAAVVVPAAVDIYGRNTGRLPVPLDTAGAVPLPPTAGTEVDDDELLP